MRGKAPNGISTSLYRSISSIYHEEASKATGKISRTGLVEAAGGCRDGQSERSFQLPSLPPNGILLPYCLRALRQTGQ